MKKLEMHRELSSLFFEVRCLIRQRIPGSVHDPNTWLRVETLRFINEHNGPSMRDVADFLHIAAPSATSLIATLARSGYVRRGRASDRRTTRIFLTPEGKKEMRRAGAAGARAMQEVFSKLSKDDVRVLTSILRRLTDLHKH